MRKPTLVFLLVISLSGCKKPDSGSVDDPMDNPHDLADPKEPKEQGISRVHLVEIVQMKFVPDLVRANKGDTIMWINKDMVEHDVTERNTNRWTSSRLPTGAFWKMVVSDSQLYFCSLHVIMTGKIIVDGKAITALESGTEITSCASGSIASATTIVRK